MGNGSVMYLVQLLMLQVWCTSYGWIRSRSIKHVTDGAVATSSNVWSSGQELGVKVSGMGITAGAMQTS